MPAAMSDAALQTTLQHLERLVAFDTRNPPRAIGCDGIFDYLRAQLPGFRITQTDHGAGAVSLLAVRGTPDTVFNVHLDTVPDAPGWTSDPHRLRIAGDQAIGLGTCDIKGAAAGLLTAAAHTGADMALLFSSDEEANDARCIAGFLATDHGFRHALVAEPTGCRAVLAHRGLESAHVVFRGRAGHASAADAMQASAVHQVMRWGTAALDAVAAMGEARFDTLSGLRFNIGRIDGGIKGNVIAPRAEARFNFRPLPGQQADRLHAAFQAPLPAGAEYQCLFSGPALPDGGAQAASRHDAARQLAQRWGLPVGGAVDFWTEAALFSRAGLTALVYGPGDIAQAHTVDEWVALDQLQRYTDTILRMLATP